MTWRHLSKICNDDSGSLQYLQTITGAIFHLKRLSLKGIKNTVKQFEIKMFYLIFFYLFQLKILNMPPINIVHVTLKYT